MLMVGGGKRFRNSKVSVSFWQMSDVGHFRILESAVDWYESYSWRGLVR
jgi:hypothetical protein